MVQSEIPKIINLIYFDFNMFNIYLTETDGFNFILLIIPFQ